MAAGPTGLSVQERAMKLQHVEMQGAGAAMRVHLFFGDALNAKSSRQWLECKIDVPVKGTMDIEAVEKAALAHLRDLLDAQIANLPQGGILESAADYSEELQARG
jgi:hypothetical protein